jgi:hypothetical protein
VRATHQPIHEEPLVPFFLKLRGLWLGFDRDGLEFIKSGRLGFDLRVIFISLRLPAFPFLFLDVNL